METDLYYLFGDKELKWYKKRAQIWQEKYGKRQNIIFIYWHPNQEINFRAYFANQVTYPLDHKPKEKSNKHTVSLVF